MISHVVAARHTALGAGICHFTSATKWKVAVQGISLEATAAIGSELSQAVKSVRTKSEIDAQPSSGLGSAHCSYHEASACDCIDVTSVSPSLPMTACLQAVQRQSPLTGALSGLLTWRLQPLATATASSLWGSTVMPLPAARGASPCFRCLHISAPAAGSAAVSAAAAAAVAAAEAASAAERKAATAATAAARPSTSSRRQQPLSPHAYEFQRRFFQLVNSGTSTASKAGDNETRTLSAAHGGGSSSSSISDGGADAAVHTTNSQAIRMLLAWLEEGRVTAATEYQQAVAAAASAAAAEGSAAAVPPQPGAAIAAPYRLDQQVIDRAMDVLWRLYHREGFMVLRNRGAATATTTTAAGTSEGRSGGSGSSSAAVAAAPCGPMGLSELLNAVEALAAAAPAMGLTLKRQHYELLIELYGKRALQEPSTRRGLAQRLLAVRQQMVQQLLSLNQSCLNTLLQGVRTDPLVNTSAKLTWAIRLLERDLPIVSVAAGAAAPTPPASNKAFHPAALSPASRIPSRSDVGLIPSLQQTLGYMLRMAAREADWSAYGKLEAALVCRTRAPPPYEVLLEALHAASAAGGSGSRLALGFLAQLEQLEAKGQQILLSPKQQPRGASGGGGGGGGRQQQQQQQRWQELEAERRLDQELRSLRQLVHVGVEQGDEQLAKKSYDRLRRLFWREHPAVAVASTAATASAVAAAKAEAAATATSISKGLPVGDGSSSNIVKERKKEVSATAATATVGAAAAGAEEAGVVEGGEEKDVGRGSSDEQEQEQELHMEDEVPEASGTAASPVTVRKGHAAVLEAAETLPAPPSATLELMSLALSRRDWVGVLDHIVALADLQSLANRSGGLVGRLLLEDVGELEGLTSAYGGLGSVSQVLIGSEDETVSYYSELLRRIGAAATAGAAAPFGGSPVPFGPPLRAAAARGDMTSVAAIVRQMRELQCKPSADSYAAVVEASLRGGKPERVSGLLELMLEEGLVPGAPLWEVQLRTAVEAGDMSALMAVSERAMNLLDEDRRAHRGIANINEEALAAAAALAAARADGRAASAVKMLMLRGEELRNQAVERRQAAEERRRALAAPASWWRQRNAAAEALRRNAASLLPPPTVLQPAPALQHQSSLQQQQPSTTTTTTRRWSQGDVFLRGQQAPQ